MPDYEKMEEQANEASQNIQHLIDVIRILGTEKIPLADESISDGQSANINLRARTLLAKTRSALAKVNAEFNKAGAV